MYFYITESHLLIYSLIMWFPRADIPTRVVNTTITTHQTRSVEKTNGYYSHSRFNTYFISK